MSTKLLSVVRSNLTNMIPNDHGERMESIDIQGIWQMFGCIAILHLVLPLLSIL